MNKYKVLGEEGAALEIPGIETPAVVGSTVDLEDEVAAPLVAEGKLELVVEDASQGTA